MLIKSRWIIGLAALGAVWMSVNGCQCSLTRGWFDNPNTAATTAQTVQVFTFGGRQPAPVRGLEAAPGPTRTGAEPALMGDPIGPVQGDRVRLEPLVAHPILLAGRRQRTFVKIGLTGFDLDSAERPPANVSIVLDRSGSMAGQKLDRAKEAAAMVIQGLRDDDLVSVVAYDSEVDVLVPTTKAIYKQDLIDRIQRYWPGSSTALYAGVVAGAAEVRKHLDRERINRVVLLSDGQANVGPSSPEVLGELGQELSADGIGVTTIGLGLGYNTELMTQLATRSEGNHFFARTAEDLATGFALEFGVGLAVVGRDAVIRVRFAEGFRPLSSLNAKATITGQTVEVHLAQLYANHKAYLLLELETPLGRAGQRTEMARIDVAYKNLKTRETDRLSKRLEVTFADSEALKREHEQAEVMEAVALVEAARLRMRAIELRERGQVSAAKRELEKSAAQLQEQSRRLGSRALGDLARRHQVSADHIGDDQDYETDVKLYSHKNMKDFGMRSRPY